MNYNDPLIPSGSKKNTPVLYYCALIPIITATTICSTYIVLMYYDVHYMKTQLEQINNIISYAQTNYTSLQDIIKDVSSIEQCIMNSRMCHT